MDDKWNAQGNGTGGRHLRIDRVLAVAIPLLLIVFLIGGLIYYSNRSQIHNQDKVSLEESTTKTATSEEVTEEKTTATDTTGAKVATPAEAETTTQEETTEHAAAFNNKISLSADGVHKGSLILVNADHSYTFPTSDANLISLYENCSDSYTASDLDIYLQKEAVEQLNALMDAYVEATGLDDTLQVYAGYRDEETQQEKYDSGKSVFQPGYSDYHTGYSINIRILFGDGTSNYYNSEKYPDYSWFAEHAAEYGFVVRFPEGKDSITGDEAHEYTFRYVGVPHAEYMYEHNLCLEEYIDLVHGYTSASPLEIETASGDTYAVYYVKANGTTPVSAIVTDEYTVSGDNEEGFVIACKE